MGACNLVFCEFLTNTWQAFHDGMNEEAQPLRSFNEFRKRWWQWCIHSRRFLEEAAVFQEIMATHLDV